METILMNIKILDSHIREFLKTKASASEIAKNLSLTSISVEKLEKISDDFIYEIEVTTNRVDLMSVIGIAREASVILPEFGIEASLLTPTYQKPKAEESEKIEIENNSISAATRIDEPCLIHIVFYLIFFINKYCYSPNLQVRKDFAPYVFFKKENGKKQFLASGNIIKVQMPYRCVVEWI